GSPTLSYLRQQKDLKQNLNSDLTWKLGFCASLLQLIGLSSTYLLSQAQRSIMLLTEFLDRLGKLDALGHVGLDDYADRINFLFTVLLLIVFSSITTLKTYFLNPITCYVPNILGSHEGQTAYITSMCYTDGLYNVPLDEFEIKNHLETWSDRYRDRKIYYYQWLPFVLAAQGVAFYAPSLFWRLFVQSRASCDLWQLARATAEAQRSDGEKREKTLRQVARQLELWLRSTRPLAGSWSDKLHRGLRGSLALSLPSKRLGTRLVWAYIAVKLMYIGNLVGQLLVMAYLVRPDTSVSLLSSVLGFSSDLVGHLATGADWRRTGLFPRSGCCAVALKGAAGKTQMSLAQCALPVNMIHEKLFAFLWLWFIVALFATLLSLCLWCTRLAPARGRRRQLTRCLRLAGTIVSQSEEDGAHLKLARVLDGFLDDFVRPDGCLVLRLLELSSGDTAVAEICAGLFRAYARAADGAHSDTIVLTTAPDEAAVPSAPPLAGQQHRLRRRSCSGSGQQPHCHHHHGGGLHQRDSFLRQQQLLSPVESSTEAEAARKKLPEANTYL
ncbi:hypothetical protein BOX15_Mlig002949g2, partial [Macrostomum lignano]